MPARPATDDTPEPARRQLNLRPGGTDHELLAQVTAATGLTASQAVKGLIRRGARRRVSEEQARRQEQERWRRYLPRAGSR